MKLWLLTQDDNDDYDTYDSLVVAAETEEAAQHIHPYRGWEDAWGNRSWARKPENVKVKYLGEAREGTEESLILGSFNAG